MSSGTKLTGLAVVVAVIIGASVWLGRSGRQSGPVPGAVENNSSPGGVTDSSASTTSSNVAGQTSNNLASSMVVSVPTSHQPSPTQSTTNELFADWNERIDEVLKGPGDERETAKSLLKLFPKFPTEGQVEAVQHISNLLPDEDYPELAKLMEDAKLPEEVLDQLIMDLLNRPQKIMLPELLQVAKNSQHAKASEAKDFLELYLEEDYGTDWNLWQSKLDEWLKAHPE